MTRCEVCQKPEKDCECCSDCLLPIEDGCECYTCENCRQSIDNCECEEEEDSE